MNEAISMTLFLITFTVMFFGMNFYVLNKFRGFFKFEKSWKIYLITAILSLSFVVFTALETVFYNAVTKLLYAISATWLGILFFTICFLLIYDLLNFIFKISKKVDETKIGSAILFIVLATSIYGVINATSFTVKTIEIPMNIEKDMKIIQVSDAHIGAIYDERFVRRIVDQIKLQKPDIVVITGDLVDGSGKLEPETFKPLSEINVPVYLTIGNHELFEKLPVVIRNLNESGVILLKNQVQIVNGIQIIGVDYSSEKDHLEKIISTMVIDRSRPSILLYHRPTEIETTSKYGINLQLSGHTHAGQLFPFNVIEGTFIYKYMNGLYKYNDTYIYVSPGTGTWGPPMRTGSRSEITVIELKKSS